MRLGTIGVCVAVAFCAAASQPLVAAQIISVSVPDGSQDPVCHPHDDAVWFVSCAPGDPLDIETGIGFLVNFAVMLGPEDFGLHEHQYVGSNVPDPNVAIVTYEFDVPVIVKQLEVVQHRNGLTEIEGFVGDSLGSMTSIGSVFGPYGDVTGTDLFAEGEVHPFVFAAPPAGKYFQLVIRKTSLSDGYAAYRVFPCDPSGQRYSSICEPTTLAVLALGACLPLLRRRRR